MHLYPIGRFLPTYVKVFAALVYAVTTIITITGLFHLPDFCVVILKLNLPKLL
jgi:hypothetical protein